MAIINGTVGKNGYSFYAELIETIPSNYIETNKTNYTLKVYIKNGSKRFNSNNWNMYLKINNTVVYNETGQNINSTVVGYNQAFEIMNVEASQPHNDDGSYTVHVEAYISKSSYGSYDPGYCYLSGDVPLTTIPRTSSITCTDGYIESAVSININRASSSFTHTLRYQFGSLSGTIATGIGTSYGWTLPSSFYSQIPNSKSGIGTIYCDTYSGGTLIGTSSCGFTARTDESKCKPNVSATVVDTNSTTIALTGDSNNLIKGVSNAKITISATAKNSSSITNRSVVCGDGKSGSGTEITLNKVESGNFTVSVTDSRGYTNSTAISKTLINYVPLTMNPNFYRPEPTSGKITLQVSGNYFNGSFGSTGNSLTLKYRYKKSGGTYPSTYTNLTATISRNSYSLSLDLGTGFDYQTSYDFEIIATDKLNTITRTIHVSEGIPMLALLKNAIEMFGTNAFTVNNNILKLNCDLVYPVGSIYMSVNSTSPATLFGGTWEQLQGRFLIGVGSTTDARGDEVNVVNGQTGGERQHLLTPSETAIRNHGHGASGSYSGANFYIRHGKNAETDTVAEGANTWIDKGAGATWSNGYDTAVYSHAIDRVNIGGTVSVSVNGSGDANATSTHNNMPPYLGVYMWKRIA